MRFLRTLDDGRFAVALEILPPQKALPRVLLRRARLLGGAPQAINVIQRPGRQSSLDASIALHQAGIEPAWHLVTRGRSRAEIESDLEAAATAGIDQVLCILGDHAGTAGPDGPTIREAIAMTRARIPGAFIGATLNQYGRDPEAVIRNLVPKLAGGGELHPDAARFRTFGAGGVRGRHRPGSAGNPHHRHGHAAPLRRSCGANRGTAGGAPPGLTARAACDR
ncbi:MAG: methylenetetrahydrofolate reductase [Dehalococcoidia bacterium]|nr:methylenetetrahydrofolate reductase [Dehalococcoidia bacterium]